MKSYFLVVAGLGLSLAVWILYLVRRDHLYIRDGVFWIIVAVSSLVLGLRPQLIDVAGEVLGVGYPPTLLFLVSVVVLVLRALTSDLALTALRRDVRRLNQKLALLEFSQENQKALACDKVTEHR